MKRLAILALLLVLMPATAKAQGLVYSFPQINASQTALSFAAEPGPGSGLLGDGRRDHRYAGMYTGFGIAALLIIGNLSYCRDPDSGCDSGRVLTRAPVVLVFLGGVGALVGRMFPKG